MKTVAIVFAICLIGAVAALNDAQRAKLREHSNLCIDEVKVDSAKVSNAKRGNVDENDEKLACYAACLLKKIGIMNADGTFNEQVTRSKIPADVDATKAGEVIDKCKSITGANDCQTGMKIYKCYLENKTFSVLE